MSRLPTTVDHRQLKELMRLKPTLADTAAFFECSERTVERIIRKEWNLSFVEFREQHMVHTRLGLVRKMIEKAMAGDNYMLIWLSKNMLGYSDKQEVAASVQAIKITKDEEKL